MKRIVITCTFICSLILTGFTALSGKNNDYSNEYDSCVIIEDDDEEVIGYNWVEPDGYGNYVLWASNITGEDLFMEYKCQNVVTGEVFKLQGTVPKYAKTRKTAVRIGKPLQYEFIVIRAEGEPAGKGW